jgi:two-component system, CitB family, sensor kinase
MGDDGEAAHDRRTSGPGPHLRGPRSWSLASQLFAIQAAVVLVVLLGAGVAAWSNASTANSRAAQDEVLGVAHSLADAPDVAQALAAPNPTAVLQPLAEQVRRDTGTDFVVVMTPDGIRYTHPVLAEIGGHFLGTIAPAAAGGTVVETFTGTLGPSVRAVVPVRDAGRIVGLVAVGQTITHVSSEMTRQLPLLAGTTVVALLVAGVGSWLASRWLRRTTHDLGPAELSRMYEYYDAVLHAVREGLLLLDRDARVQLVNDEARRLLGLPDAAVGRRVDDLGLPAALGGALATGRPRSDEIFLTDDRVVVVNQAAARWAGQRLGTVVTLRDHTELRALVSELKTIRGFAEALSAQAHESANQLQTVISLIELGRADEALRFAATELAVAQHLTDLVVSRIGEPELAALVLGKAAEAGERGVALQVVDDIDVPAGVADPRDLVTIVGNLLDNAVDAAAEGPSRGGPDGSAGTAPDGVRHPAGGRPAGQDGPSEAPPTGTARGAATEAGQRWVRLEAGTVAVDGVEELEIVVADSGPGLEPDAAVHAFERGWTTKQTDRPLGRGIGLALVAQAVHRLGGSIDVANEVGAVFAVRLPRRRRPALPPDPAAVGVGPAGATNGTLVGT